MSLIFKPIATLFYISLVISNCCYSAVSTSFEENTKYDVCFTPGQDCTSLIVNEINSAKDSIYLQAYSFTSAPIAKAIIDAKTRGVNVNAILDKSQFKTNSYSSSQYLINNNVPVWIDYKPAIAHNKILILDNKIVITGSFNFTKAAQLRNAENVLVIRSSNLAEQYLANWQKRKSMSKSVGA